MSKIAIFIEGTHGLSRIVSLLPKIHIVPVLRYYGAEIGKNCDIDIGLLLHRLKLPLSNLKIGDNVHIGHRCFLDLTREIVFEDNSAIGSYTMLITHSGDFTIDRQDYKEVLGRITLERSSVVYSGCIVGAGVTIGDFARVAANSTILKDVPEYTFVAGSPASVKKNRKHLIQKK